MPLEWQVQRWNCGEVGLNVHAAGRGPTVLLLHGFPDSGGMWRDVGAILAGHGHRVIAPDLRGFGESDAPAGRRHYALRRVTSDLLALLDQAGCNEPVGLIGDDWGAVTGWCLSLWHPERVAAFVAVSVGHPREYALAGLEQKRKGLYTMFWQLPGVAEASLSRNGFAGLRRWLRQHPDPQSCVRDLSRPGRLTAGLNYYRANFATVMLGSWPRCRVPTLGLWGSEDAFLAEDQMRRSARRMAAPWSYARLDGAGHWLSLDRPRQVAELALDWLARKH